MPPACSTTAGTRGYIPQPALPTVPRTLTGEGRPVEWDRDTIASAIVGTGGAWLLGSVVLQGRSGRWNAAQRRGLLYAGAGFLLCAMAARWLQGYGNAGIAVSLVGTMLAMRGMYTLVRERAALRAAKGSARKPRTPE